MVSFADFAGSVRLATNMTAPITALPSVLQQKVIAVDRDVQRSGQSHIALIEQRDEHLNAIDRLGLGLVGVGIGGMRQRFDPNVQKVAQPVGFAGPRGRRTAGEHVRSVDHRQQPVRVVPFAVLDDGVVQLGF